MCNVDVSTSYRFAVLLPLTAPEDVVMAAEELRYAGREIGKITGRVGVDDVLDAVFREFCIGK